MGGFRLEFFVFEGLRLWVLRLEVFGFGVLRLWVLRLKVVGFRLEVFVFEVEGCGF